MLPMMLLRTLSDAAKRAADFADIIYTCTRLRCAMLPAARRLPFRFDRDIPIFLLIRHNLSLQELASYALLLSSLSSLLFLLA